MAGATAAAGGCCRRTFFFLAAGAALEIAGVPAIALELEAGGGKLLGERLLAAFGASGERSVADFAHDFRVVAATAAAVFVNRHLKIPPFKSIWNRARL